MQLSPVGSLVDDSTVDHLNIQNIGANSHASIDIHIADAALHFPVASIDHTAIGNVGVNTHPQIDTAVSILVGHVSDGAIHFTDAPADGSGYVRNNNAWVLESGGVADHTLLSNIGVNTHVQIDTHIADATIHYADAPADGSGYVRNNNAWVVQSAGVTDHTLLTNIGVNTHAAIDGHIADGTLHFTEASIDHANIGSIGVNSHLVIDAHIADAAIHFAVGAIDHTAILSIGTNSHAAIDTHIADATLHFTAASIDHTAILNIGTNSHAAIDTHIADGTIHLNEAAIDLTHLRLDTANDPLTGELATQNLVSDGNTTRDVGIISNRYRRMFGRVGVFVNSPADPSITFPANADHGGIIAGTQNGPGTTRHTLNGNAFAATAAVGVCAANAVGGQADIRASRGGATAIGASYAYTAGGIATLQATGYAATAMGYAYGSGTSLLEATGPGTVCFGYAGGRSGTGAATVRSSGSGSFAAGFARGFSGSGTALIEATSNGAFASGYTRVTSTANAATIRASGRGSFAQGQAQSSLAGVGLIEAISPGSFAVGDAAPGQSIRATANNAAQFGPGTNSLADSLQVGGAGVRFKGTVGAPAAPQNGDIWINGAFVYIRSNGASIQVAGPGPLTN